MRTRTEWGPARARRRGAVLVLCAALGAGAAAQPAGGARSKPCKPGYEKKRKTGTCVKRVWNAPSRINIVVATLKNRQIGATGTMYFDGAPSTGYVLGHWKVRIGPGFTKYRYEHKALAKGRLSNFTGFTPGPRLTPGTTATVQLFIGKTASNVVTVTSK